MIEDFKKFMQDNGLSENSYTSYANDIKLFNQYYLDSYGEDLKTLIHSDVLMYINYLRTQNNSPQTINRKIAAIKQYNLYLVEKGIQDNIVIVAKDYIKIQSSIINKKLPTKQEINKLLHEASKDGTKKYCLVCIHIFAGLRADEIVTLRLIDIRLNDRFINVIGKGNKFRQVVINDILYNALDEYLEERLELDTENPYLFVSQKSKNKKVPYNRNYANRTLNKYKELCNLSTLYPHLLRAYFCTNALHNAGYKIDQVANQARSL